MADETVPVARLDEYVTELTVADSEADLQTERSDLCPVADALADATVVGLGEATHGTSEFVRLRRRLVELLVTELDVRLFGLEANFAEALALDDYVVRGDGDPREAIDGLGVWAWNTEEMLALVEWLREFNADRPVDDRVRFYGFDAQFVEEPATAVREYLADADPAFLADVDDDLRLLESTDVRGERYPVASQHVGDVEATVVALVDRFERRSDEYVARTSRASYELSRRHLRTIEQATAFASASLDADEPRGATDLRDEFMAENVAWILEHETVEQIVLWAHNGHLLKEGAGARWDEFTPMGHHLAERFGEGYRVVGTDFDRGSFLAIPDPEVVDDPEPRPFAVESFHEDPPYGDEEWPPDRTVGEALTALDADAVLFDVAAAADDPRLEDWLDRHHPVRDVGNAFWDESRHLEGYRLPAEMDGLLFVAETTRTTLLDGEETD